MSAISAGEPAPTFSLNNQDHQKVSLKDFAGSWLVLYFYPKDLTSGCTIESDNFNKNLKKFEKLGAKVVGVSCDDEASHQKFIKKLGLKFDLLADVEQKIVKDYGVWVEKSMYGKKFMGIQRDTFLIDPDGKIQKHYVKVKPAEHWQEVLEDLEKLV